MIPRAKIIYFYNYLYNYNIQYDLVNVFQYKNPQRISKLEKFIVTFEPLLYPNFIFFTSFLQLLSSKKGYIVNKRTSSSFIQKTKQKKIYTIFELKKRFLFNFFLKTYKEVFSSKKSKIKFFFKKSKTHSFLLYNINRFIFFNLIKNNYMIFKKLENCKSNLSFTLMSNTIKLNTFIFLLRSYKIV